MHTDRYCEDHVRNTFPSFFYALLFVPLQQRQACMALFALYAELLDIAYGISDQGVAHKKLHFWHEELERYAQKKSRHPVTVALQNHCQYNATQQKYLLKLLHGCAFHIAPQPILNTQDFQQYSQNQMNALLYLLCDILHIQTTTALAFADTLSLAWQYMHNIQQLHLDIQQKRLFLPQQDRVKFKVSDTQLFQAQQKDNSDALFQHYDARIQQLCQQAETLLHPNDRQALKLLLVITPLLQQQWQRTSINPLQPHPDILPIKRIWKAWRTHRFEKKTVRKNNPNPVRLR